MQEITKHIQQITTTVNLEFKSDKFWQFLKQIKTAIKRWYSLFLGMLLLASWILLTVQSVNGLIKEVLVSAIIIACLLLLKGPNSAGDSRRNN